MRRVLVAYLTFGFAKGGVVFGGVRFAYGSASRFRAVACVGYALLLFVCQMTLWGGLLLTSRTALDVLGLIRFWSVPLCAASAAACFVVAVAWRRPHRRARLAGLATALASGAAMVAGYELSVFPGASDVAVCAGASVLGAGMAAAFSLWCSVFSRMGRARAVGAVFAATAAGSALSLLATGLSLEAVEAAFFIAVALSSALLAAAWHEAASAPGVEGALPSRPSSEGRLRQMKESLPSMTPPLLCACAIAFAVAITRMMALASAPAAGGAINASGVLLSGCAAGALLAASKRKAEGPDVDIPGLFRIAFPLIATLLLVMSVAGSYAAVLAGAAVFSVHSVMFALMVPACIEGAANMRVSAVAAWGFFAGAVYASFALATALGAALFSDGAGWGAQVSFVALLLVFYVLAMAFVLLQRRQGERCAAAGAVRSDAARDASGAAACEEAGETEHVETDGARCRARRTGEACSGADPAGTGLVPGESEEDPIERRCRALARRYALSPRETDVLVAFAHGRNVAYLAESLVLSANTIRSHSKTLYAKLGVHSKQELIDLVEQQR